MSVNSKVELVNDLRDNILFFNDNLYKIIKGNTLNIYAFEYVKDKTLNLDTALTFYSICDHVSYYNFKNVLKPDKLKLRVKDILNDAYQIITVNDISNLYFIQFIQHNIKKVTIKDDYNESLFCTDIDKLKGIYDIKHFIQNMTTHMMNNDTEYYRSIRARQLENKKYFNRNYTSDEIKELCETDVEFIKSTTYEQYINIM